MNLTDHVIGALIFILMFCRLLCQQTQAMVEGFLYRPPLSTKPQLSMDLIQATVCCEYVLSVIGLSQKYFISEYFSVMELSKDYFISKYFCVIGRCKDYFISKYFCVIGRCKMYV